MLLLLLTLVSTSSLVDAQIDCLNYVNGNEVTIQCDGFCCIEGESYAISLSESDVCPDSSSGECSPNTIPTSCPVRLDGQWKMYGCRASERCCFPLDGPVPQYTLSIDYSENICSRDGYCPTGGEFSGADLGVQLAAITPDNNGGVVLPCYQGCYLAKDFDAVDGFMPNKLECADTHDSPCDSSLQEYCLAFDTELETVMSSNDGSVTGITEHMSVRLSYCGTLTDESTPADLCNRVNYDILSGFNTDSSGSGYHLDQIESSCEDIFFCGPDCYNLPREEDEDFPWWIILIVLVVVMCCILAGILLYFICCRRKSVVEPEDEEIAVETLDPRTLRLREVERFAHDALRSRDMAQLKLAIDMIEEEGFKDDLDPMYRDAVNMFNELMKRSEMEKAAELKRAEEEAEAVRLALEEAEREVERRKREADEEARRRAIKKRDEIKARWMRLWPKLQVLRALNAVNAEAAAKAMEEAKRAREEAERQRREAEERERVARQCKKLLKDALSMGTEEALFDAIKKCDSFLYQTEILQEDNELRTLYSRAASELDRLQRERKKREEEAERRRREEERVREEKRRAALARLGDMETALRTAVKERDIDLLKRAIHDVESNAVEGDMPELYKQGVELLARLQKIEAVKKNIMELKRPLIAELKSMSNPPPDVHKTMIATYLLLGEDLSKLKDWNNIVILLNKTGKLSIKRRIQEFRVQSLSAALCTGAEKQIEGLTADEVYDANQAASLFYDWAEMICYESKQGNE